LETSYSGLGNGLKLNLNADSKDINPGFEYRRPNLTVFGQTDVSMSNTLFNFVFGQRSFLVGAQLAYNQKKNLSYDLAFGYENPSYFFGVELLKSLSSFRLGGFYQFNKLTTVSARVEGTPEDPANLITLGVSYKPECNATIKAKVDSKLNSAVSIQYQCTKGVKFTSGLSSPLSDFSQSTIGAEFTLS